MIGHVLFLIGNGILLGLGAAAPIGPVNVEIARRSLRFGWLAGFTLGCGAATVDMGYAVITSLVSVNVLKYPILRNVLGVAGALFLGYLAWLCFRSARNSFQSAAGNQAASANAPNSADDPPAAPGHHTHFVTGLLMTSLNPMTLVFWFVGVPGAVAQIAVNLRTDLPLVCGGVFIGAFGWACFFSIFISYLGRFGKQRWLAWVDLVGGIILLSFALISIWRVTQSAL